MEEDTQPPFCDPTPITAWCVLEKNVFIVYIQFGQVTIFQRSPELWNVNSFTNVHLNYRQPVDSNSTKACSCRVVYKIFTEMTYRL